jgi:glc operon protein GlcG
MSSLPLRLSLLALVFATPALAQPLVRKAEVLNHAGAQAALAKAEALAVSMNAPSAIAVVDRDGLLLAFDQMDNVRSAGPDLAIGKARAAAGLERPTSELEDNVAKGRFGLATVGLTALRGGAPVRIDGMVVGAIGVAGRDKDQDARIAAAAADALSSAP